MPTQARRTVVSSRVHQRRPAPIRTSHGSAPRRRSASQAIIRPIRKSDLSVLAQINSLIFNGHRGSPEEALAWVSAHYRFSPVYHYFVIALRGKVVGYIGWRIEGGFLRPDPALELEQLGVLKKFEGRGYASRLQRETLDTMVEIIKKRNTRIESYLQIFVWAYSTNLNAIAVYLKVFNEGAKGIREIFGARSEIMYRGRVPMLSPVRGRNRR